MRWNTKRLRRDELLHFALDVREEEGFFQKQKLATRRIKSIFEFKKRLIDDACHLIRRINEDCSRSGGESDACSCLMLLCLRFGRKTNRVHLFANHFFFVGLERDFSLLPSALRSKTTRRTKTNCSCSTQKQSSILLSFQVRLVITQRVCELCVRLWVSLM